MKKILILTAGFGDGHNSAARSLRDALELISDEVQVEVFDLFQTAYSSLSAFIRRAHLGIVRYAPTMWGGLYSLLDNSRLLGSGLSGLSRLKASLGVVLEETQPDWVVSTYPVYAHLIHQLYYIINHGKRKVGKVLDRLLEMRDVHLTITVGRDAALKAKLLERTRSRSGQVEILGWTNDMPRLMLTHHLLIGKAGGATVQEAIAARCPIIVNQIIPGQEEGNAQLVRDCEIGGVAEKARDLAQLVERVFSNDAKLWQKWRKNLARISRPDASLRLAEMILDEGEGSTPPSRSVKLFEVAPKLIDKRGPTAPSGCSQPGMLLCDFHIHSKYSL